MNFHKPQAYNNQPKNQQSRVKIFVYGLHPYTTKSEIEEEFSKSAKIFDIEFNKNKKTGRHKGYAFFSVESLEVVRRLMSEKHVIHGRKVNCDFKLDNREKEVPVERKRLFVGGLPKWATDDDIAEFFGYWGPVKAAYSIKTLLGKSRGFGFADFYDIETVERILDEEFLSLKGKKIEVRRYRKRESGGEESVETNSGGDSESQERERADFSDSNSETEAQISSSEHKEEHQNGEDRSKNHQNLGYPCRSQHVQHQSRNRYHNGGMAPFDSPISNPLKCFMNCKGEEVIRNYKLFNSLMLSGRVDEAMVLGEQIRASFGRLNFSF